MVKDCVDGAAEQQSARNYKIRAVPQIILGGTFFSDPSTPRTHMESEPPDPQDTQGL